MNEEAEKASGCACQLVRLANGSRSEKQTPHGPSCVSCAVPSARATGHRLQTEFSVVLYESGLSESVHPTCRLPNRITKISVAVFQKSSFSVKNFFFSEKAVSPARDRAGLGVFAFSSPAAYKARLCNRVAHLPEPAHRRKRKANTCTSHTATSVRRAREQRGSPDRIFAYA